MALSTTPTRRNAVSFDTELTIMRAAERLLAMRGVDSVSLREVGVAAKHGNTSGVRYHFESREGLIDAILARHATPIQARYDAQIDLLERQGVLTTRALLEVLVLPIVSKLDDPDGGRDYLEICAQLCANPSFPFRERPIARTPQVLRLEAALLHVSGVPTALAALHLERCNALIYLSIVAYARRNREDAPSREVFTEDLLQTVGLVLTGAPQ